MDGRGEEGRRAEGQGEGSRPAGDSVAGGAAPSAAATELARLLREARERRGLSQKELAHAVGLSPAMMNYLESGERRPGRETVLRLASALGLDEPSTDRLLVAGGHLPAAYDRTPPSDPDLVALAGVLGDERIPPEERATLRLMLRLALTRWRPELVDSEALLAQVRGTRR